MYEPMAPRNQAGKPGFQIAMATVLILDDDLGFVFWVAQTLAGAGFESIPAQSVAEAKRLLNRLSVTVDVVIVSPRVAGAFDYIRELRGEKPGLAVVAAVDQAADLMIVRREVDAVRAKPDVLSEAAMPEWQRTVRRAYSRRAKEPKKKASAHEGR
jgi:DNA-binding NtrC family response regulator